MGKNKLQKFDDLDTFPHVFQYPFAVLQSGGGCPQKGQWSRAVFGNRHPLTLELGCGRGEYTVRLGQLLPEKNFIGIDIKGARMWSGAKASLEAGMKNVAFLRTDIERISHFFAPGEIDEIWLTFPDPQMKKVNRRLTGTRFMRLYREILSDKGLIHLKTDSPFLYTYTCEMIKANHYPVHICTDNLYHSGIADEILSIRTYYEQQWLDRGLTIKYIRFACEPRDTLIEPDPDIEPDPYRSYHRSRRSSPATEKRTHSTPLSLTAGKKEQSSNTNNE